MPNWVRNRVRAKNKDDAQKLISILVKEVNGNKKMNFNGVIPMPEEIRNAESPNRDHKLSEALKRKFGYGDWYSWAINNWGTKWDNNDVFLGPNGEIAFDTAWCMPIGVYEEIAKTIPIIVAYADEDIGWNCGLCEFDGNQAEVLEAGINPTQLANAVWNASEDEMENFSEEVQEKGR